MPWPRGRSTIEVHLPGDGPRTAKIAMHGHKGADQVARALGQMGWEGFEAPLPSAVVRILRRWPGVLLDVGANTGFYSLIAVASGPDTTAIAYEPVPAIVEMLRANLRLNRASGRVTVEELAIGDRSGRATLHLPPPQPDGTIETSVSLEPDFKEVIASSFEVRTSTLDDAWRASGRTRRDDGQGRRRGGGGPGARGRGGRHQHVPPGGLHRGARCGGHGPPGGGPCPEPLRRCHAGTRGGRSSVPQ